MLLWISPATALLDYGILHSRAAGSLSLELEINERLQVSGDELVDDEHHDDTH